MTLKQYNYLKNARVIAIVIGVAYFIFGAGAVFTGYKPTTANYAIMIVVLVNLINAILNKPTPPSQM